MVDDTPIVKTYGENWELPEATRAETATILYRMNNK